MKLVPKIIFSLMAFFVIGLMGCKPAAEAPAAAPEKAGVTIDAETQTRIGLKIETPVATQWQPEIHAVGRVVDPLLFAAAAADYEAARATAKASQSELERMQKLAAGDNASPRALETAQAAAAHDAMAFKSAQAKFTADWGVHLAAQTNLDVYATQLQAGDNSLIKLSLPAGTFPNPLPSSAVILLSERESDQLVADFADDLAIDPATQVQTLLFSVDKKMPPSLAVTGQLKIAGEPVAGVVVPADAVLRHEGKGWVYVQTETNQFARVEVALDRLTGNGWFVTENLSATNRIVTAGAQTILSAELSGGGFNTGQRD